MTLELLALCAMIESGSNGACQRCLCAMPERPVLPLCLSCTQLSCADLAAAVRKLISERDVALRDRSIAVNALDEFNVALEQRGKRTADSARRLELLERKVKRLAEKQPVAHRKKARR